MVDLNTNTTTNTTAEFTAALNNVLAASDGSIDELHAINQAILTGEGIDQIIEAFEEENPAFAQALRKNKTELKKPNVELKDLMGLSIDIPEEVAEKLGLAGINNNNEKVTVNIGDFRQAALKEALKDNKNTFGLGNLNSETIDLLCLLLCQGSKEELITTLREVLKSKVTERQELSNEYQTRTADMAKEEIEAIKAAEKAKKMSIISAVLSAVLAVVITAVSIAFTVATCGAGAAAIGLAAVAVTASIASAAAAIAGSTCTIIALNTDDSDKKEKLDKAALVLGIASAVLGLVGGLAEVGASMASSAAKIGAKTALKVAEKAGYVMSKSSAKAIGKAAAEAAEGIVKNSGKDVAEETLEQIVKNVTKGAIKKEVMGLADDVVEEMAEAVTKNVVKRAKKGDLMKFLQKIDTIVTFGSSVTQGATQIATGVMNIESAKTQRNVADIKIEMAKLDQEIETLVAFIDTLTQDIQKFMEDYLKNEQEAGETLHNIGDVLSQLAQKPA